MAWDRSEVPVGGLDERLSNLRARMCDEGFDAVVIYTNIARGAAVWWLTGFTPYWNEGLLYVPAQGEMIFATALSKRVADWIESVMPAGRVVTTPKPSVLSGNELGEAGAKRIGVLELDDFPAGHAQAILQAVPDAMLVDATSAYAAARAGADAGFGIANHALVMVNAARGRESTTRPTRYVFDEGHHLFDAADAMFSTALTGAETIELRRWVLGPESGGRGRRRGLAARLSAVASYDEGGARAIADAVPAAQGLASDGWLQRIGEGAPFGPIETLLAAVRGLTYARAEAEGDAGYALETELAEPDPGLIEAAGPAAHALDSLVRPMVALGRRLEAVLDEGPDWMDGPARARIEGAVASLGWRAETVAAWLSLLARIGGPASPDFVDWLAVDRVEGREYDIGLHRHWLDPTRPFAETVLKQAHGVLVTSATLRGGGDWDVAEARTGANHLLRGASRFEAISPFNYADQAEVLIVTDVKRGDMGALANAHARAGLGSGGGGVGAVPAAPGLRGGHAPTPDPP
eukprot:gene22297-23408_t